MPGKGARTNESAKEITVHDALPVHPFLLHPRTGAPLRAAGILRSGRVVWPIMGGDGTEDDANDKGGGGGGDKPAGADKPTDTGFPANTPVVEMTAAQQTAYWKHQAKKHETRNAELMQITGNKYGDALKSELDELGKLRTAQMSDADKAIAAARSEAAATTAQTAGASAARVALEFALGHDAENNDQSAVIDALDLAKLVNPDGSIAADKVRALVNTIAPSVKGSGGTTRQPADYGAGSRANQPSGKAGQAGASEADRRFGKPSGE